MEAFVNKRTKLFLILVSILRLLFLSTPLCAEPPLGVFIKSRLHLDQMIFLKMGHQTLFFGQLSSSMTNFKLPHELSFSFDQSPPKKYEVSPYHDGSFASFYTLLNPLKNVTAKTKAVLHYDNERQIPFPFELIEFKYTLIEHWAYEVQTTKKNKRQFILFLSSKVDQKNPKDHRLAHIPKEIYSPLSVFTTTLSYYFVDNISKFPQMLTVAHPNLKKSFKLLPFAPSEDHFNEHHSLVKIIELLFGVILNIEVDQKALKNNTSFDLVLKPSKSADLMGMEDIRYSLKIDQIRKISLEELKRIQEHHFSSSLEEIEKTKTSQQEEVKPQIEIPTPVQKAQPLIPQEIPKEIPLPKQPDPSLTIIIIIIFIAIFLLMLPILFYQLAKDQKNQKIDINQKLALNEKKENPDNLIEYTNNYTQKPLIEVYDAISLLPLKTLTVTINQYAQDLSFPLPMDVLVQLNHGRHPIQIHRIDYQSQIITDIEALSLAQKDLKLYLYPYQALLSLKYQKLFQKLNQINPNQTIAFEYDLMEKIKDVLHASPLETESKRQLADFLEQALFDQSKSIHQILFKKINILLDQAIKQCNDLIHRSQK